MPGYFLDTSALVKLYHPEAGSDYVLGLMHPSSELIISPLSLIEMESVLAIKVRTGELNAAGQDIAHRRMRADIVQQRIHVGPPIIDRHYQAARRFLMSFGASMGLRSLDALQLAVALDLNQTARISVLVAADRRLCQVAEALGCATVDPANPNLVTP